MMDREKRLLLLVALACVPCLAWGEDTRADAGQATAMQATAVQATAVQADVVVSEVTVGEGATAAAPAADPVAGDPAADTATESVEVALANLERDLAILEEDLLYPPSSRVAVYLSLDVGELFALDEVEVKLNGETVAHHLYTSRQVNALARGGVQRLFVGNAKQGSNEITAFFLGRGTEGRELRRGTTATFDKGFEPLFVELQIRDSETLQRPEMSVEVH